MSQSSHVLGLPYIQPAQAQKHVTHNEAIRVLDALVQLSVADRDQTTPPASPTAGDRHIVPTAASGDWAGQDGSIAVFEDAAWAFYAPQNGWQAVVRGEGVALIWDGTDWVGLGVDASSLQNLDSLGVNTTADTTNRLAVSSNATLLSHAGDDHRVVVNKNAVADTASLLFQTGYSGRAEMGTAGSDDFAVKISADATTWNTGVSFDATTGRAEFPSGAMVSNRLDVGGRIYCFDDNRWVTHNNFYGTLQENVSSNAGTAADPDLSWTQLGALVDKGSKMQALKMGLWSNSPEVSAFDARVYFQTGPWSGGWSSNAAVTRTLIGSATAEPAGSEITRATIDLAGFETPDDGFLLFFFKPVGAITATRYLHCRMCVSFLSTS